MKHFKIMSQHLIIIVNNFLRSSIKAAKIKKKYLKIIKKI